MIEKIQIVIIENVGKTKAKSIYEVDKKKLSQRRLEEIKKSILEILDIKEGVG